MTPARSASLVVLALGLAACRQQQPAPAPGTAPGAPAAPGVPTAPGAPAPLPTTPGAPTAPAPGAPPAPAPGAAGTFRPQDNTYGVVIPSGWTVQDQGQMPPDLNGNAVPGSRVVVASGTQPPIGAFQLTSSPVPVAVNLEAEMTGAITGLQQAAGAGITGVSESGRQAISAGGLNGMEHILTYTQQGTPMRTRIIYAMGNGRLYSMALIAPQQSYNQAEPAFLSMVQSFRPG